MLLAFAKKGNESIKFIHANLCHKKRYGPGPIIFDMFSVIFYNDNLVRL